MRDEARQREEATKDRFVLHLRETEAVDYVTKARDVPAKNLSRNFDRFLESTRGTLALEITGRNNEPQEMGDDKKTGLVWAELERLIQPSTLPGAFCVRAPSTYLMSISKLKNMLKMAGHEVAEAIRETMFSLSVGQNVDLCTRLGPFNVRRLRGSSDLYFTGARENYRTAQDRYDEVLLFLERTVRKKNDQLDTDAARRVLLISNEAHFGNAFLLEAAMEFFGAERDDINNIDEVFVEISSNDFRRVYPPAVTHNHQ